jgi:hypothetical protein
VFCSNPEGVSPFNISLENVQVIPLDVDRRIQNYWLGEKVLACSTAEALVGGDVRSLVWMNSRCLIIYPPHLFDLGTSFQAAFRPVHIKNVGLSVHEPIDAFWKGIYWAVGVDPGPYQVDSFIERE